MSRRSASRGGLGLLKKGRGAVVGTWRRLDSWMRADPKVQAILTWADENTLERTALVMVVHQCLLLWLAGPWLNKLSSLVFQLVPLSFLPWPQYLAISLLSAVILRWVPLLCFHFAVAVLKYAIWAPTWWTQLGLAAAITAYCWQAPRINIVIAIALVYAGGGGLWSLVFCLVWAALTQYLDLYAITGLFVMLPLLSIRWFGVLLTLSVGIVVGICVGVYLFWRTRRMKHRRKKFEQRTGDAAEILTSVEHLPQQEVPVGASSTVTAILSARNHYQVLGLEASAEDAAVRKAKRALSLATHPDKATGNSPGAESAFRMVTEAAEVLLDADKRAEYDTELELALHAPGMMQDLAREVGFEDAEEFAEAVALGAIMQDCPICGMVHWLRPLWDLDPRAARVCDECPGKPRHPVKEGEIWLERQRHRWSSDTLRVLLCNEGRIWDMSEMAACEGLFDPEVLRGFPFNSHYNPLMKYVC